MVSPGGYSTTFVIVNTGTSAISSTLTFYYQGGAAAQYQALTDQIATISSAAAAALPALANYSPANVSQFKTIAAQAGASSQLAAQLSAQMRAVDILISATGQ